MNVRIIIEIDIECALRSDAYEAATRVVEHNLLQEAPVEKAPAPISVTRAEVFHESEYPPAPAVDYDDAPAWVDE